MANQIQATIYQIDGNPQASAITVDFLTSELVIREAAVDTIPAVQSAILYYNVVNNQQSVQTYYAGETVAALVALANNGETSHTQATVLEINGDPQVPGGIQYSFPSAAILIGQSINPTTGVNAFIQYKGIRYFTSETQATLYNNSNAGGGGGIIVVGSGIDSSIRCGLGNTASGYESISLGSCNSITGQYAASLFGIANCATQCRSFASGLNNVVAQNDSYIFGGSFNTINDCAPASTSVSGYFDGFCNGVTVTYSSYGDLTSQFGAGTTISSQYAYGYTEQPVYLNMTVCGSSYNPATCETTICVDPSISTCSGYFIKRGPYISSTYSSYSPSVIVGGAFNTLTCYTSGGVMLGGCFNTGSGYTVTIGGYRNLNNGYKSNMIGGSCNCSVAGSKGTIIGSIFSSMASSFTSEQSSIISSYCSSIGVSPDNYGITGNIYGSTSSHICKTCCGQSYIPSGNIIGSAFSCIENASGSIFGGGGNIISQLGNGNIFGGDGNRITTGAAYAGSQTGWGGSTIVGGLGNTICSTCLSGLFINGLGSIISGACASTIFGVAYQSNISGGIGNCITSCWDTIGGGLYHCVTGGYSVVAGGGCNCILGSIGGAIGGGFCNIVNCNTGTIAGGRNSTMSNRYATIGGGRNHTVSGYAAVVSGGRSHIASSNYTAISGGYQNTVSGLYASVTGGRLNVASGDSSAIVGGRSNTTSGYACAMIVGSNITADRACATFVNNLSIKNIPTSSAGLPAGSVWNNSGVLNIV